MSQREEFITWVRTVLRDAETAVHNGDAEMFSDCTSYEFELLEAEVFGNVACTVGFEHTSASVNGVPSNYTLRATQISRREDGEWKVVHRHGSAPPS